ncbi:MAG TPA: inner membrane CreD family protein [Candidatus Acidoferrales bacterium]|nr:inner membrane CreD family protein [Candidatus Acidoferrales bacterium]
MGKRIAALLLIFVCTSLAWALLGSTILLRTYDSDSSLRDRVASTWGTPQEQSLPSASFLEPFYRTVESTKDGKKVVETFKEERTISLPLEASRIRVALDLEHRQKGLLWYSTYKVAFAGDYTFLNPSDKEQSVTFKLPFPAERAIYDKLVFTVNGTPVSVSLSATGAVGSARIGSKKTAILQVGYLSHGLDSWRYKFGGEVTQLRDFELRMTTNFKKIDFPDNTLSPTDKRETPSGWELTWSYENLLSGFQIGMTMPEKLQPGPLAGRISYFAPVSLFFFFFLILIITTLRNIDLHPMNYFFLAAAFFAFHLLLAYLVDHLSIHLAFVLSSIVSVFLVVSYLRLVVGLRFAAIEGGLAQLVYLVLFSYAFFLEGFTGLAVTIGSIISLFVVMQLTGRIRWAEKFASSQPGRPRVGAL